MKTLISDIIADIQTFLADFDPHRDEVVVFVFGLGAFVIGMFLLLALGER